MYKICLVEDEKDLNNLIKNYLEHEGYNVIPIYSGNEALNIIGKETINLWILDIMLGDEISGYDSIKKIRSIDSDVPVIFTSARDQDLDKIIGLELGSDDYITKPYSPKELVLRVNKLIDRIYKNNKKILEYETYKIDVDKRTVVENEEIITSKEEQYDKFKNNGEYNFSKEE